MVSDSKLFNQNRKSKILLNRTEITMQYIISYDNKIWFILPQIRNYQDVEMIHILTTDTINTVNGTALYKL